MMSDEDVEIDVEGCDDETAAAAAAARAGTSAGASGSSSPSHEFFQLSDCDDDDAVTDGDDDDDLDENEVGEFAEKGKRAHHNALEKQRREDMKRNYRVLKNTIPWLKGKKASRCQILRMATAFMRSKRKEIAKKKLIKAALEEKVARIKKVKEEKEKADQK